MNASENLKNKLETALNEAISNNQNVSTIIKEFKDKKEFLETSKEVLKKWIDEIDQDLKSLDK